MELGGEGHSVAIIDRTPKCLPAAAGDWKGARVVGSGFDRDDLEPAGAIASHWPR